MNKRGDEKVLSLWWFLILILVGLCIFAGTTMFLSKEIDIRNQEASLVYLKFSNCLIKDDSVLSDNFFSDSGFYTLCNINEEVFDEGFYINISLKDSSGNLEKELILGNKEFQKQCEIVLGKNGKSTSAESYARCYENKESVSYFKNGQKYNGEVSFLSASNSQGKRLK